MSANGRNTNEAENGHFRKALVRSNATCDDDDTNLRSAENSVRLVNSQTKPALSSSASKDSTCFTDATDTDLHAFIVKTLHKNEKDRKLILRTEEALIALDERRVSPPMTSYERMIVHRVSAYFGLDHNVGQSGKNVVSSKTPKAKIPEHEFKTLISGKPYTDQDSGRSTAKPRMFSGPSGSSSAMVAGSSTPMALANQGGLYYPWQPPSLMYTPSQQPMSLMQIQTGQFGNRGNQPMQQAQWYPNTANLYSIYQNAYMQPCATSMSYYAPPTSTYAYDAQSQQFNTCMPINTSHSSFANQPSTRNY
ncbi:Encore-like [Aphelenchoides fujianensis]|nr:Encore-like [Aphelenchoides fujianensis]